MPFISKNYARLPAYVEVDDIQSVKNRYRMIYVFRLTLFKFLVISFYP